MSGGGKAKNSDPSNKRSTYAGDELSQAFRPLTERVETTSHTLIHPSSHSYSLHVLTSNNVTFQTRQVRRRRYCSAQCLSRPYSSHDAAISVVFARVADASRRTAITITTRALERINHHAAAVPLPPLRYTSIGSHTRALLALQHYVLFRHTLG